MPPFIHMLISHESACSLPALPSASAIRWIKIYCLFIWQTFQVCRNLTKMRINAYLASCISAIVIRVPFSCLLFCNNSLNQSNWLMNMKRPSYRGVIFVKYKINHVLPVIYMQIWFGTDWPLLLEREAY